jgi:hypothetical protein
MNLPRNAEELFNPDAGKSDPSEAITGGRVRTGDVKALQRKALSDTAVEITDENDIREVLALPSGAGLRFLARLIEACGWNTPHFHPSNSIMSEVAGRRSIAWQLEGWISDADLDLWLAVRRQLELKRQKPKALATDAGASKRGSDRT